MAVQNYKCPNCDAPLHFDAATGKLTCEYCEGIFDTSDFQWDEGTASGESAEITTDPEKVTDELDESIIYGGSRAEDTGNWDTSELTDDWGEDASKLGTFLCPACGAGLICEANTGATSCPYCGNPAILPGKFEGALKPDFVIPFKMTREQAKDRLVEHYRGKPLLPARFKSENHIKELKGIYVPFWLFDAHASGDARYHATTQDVYETSEYKVIKTHHYDVYREGDMAFSKVPTDASQKMPDDIMDSIEPFDYSALEAFNPAMLAGFLADKYDVTVEENSQRADNRCKNSLQDALRDTVTGYSSVTIKDSYSSIARGRVHYAMLPVYMLRTHWEDKDYIFAINGQTGKCVGNLPIHKGKAFLFGLIGAICGGGLGYLISLMFS